MARIWLVEDEATIADTLIYRLESDDYKVRWFERGELMLDALDKVDDHPHLLLLDVGLPDIIGFDLAKIVLAKFDIPIIFLTAFSQEKDRIAALELGADDYITKPFSPKEVSARVKAVFKRLSKKQMISHILSLGHFLLDEESAFIHYFDKALNLTRHEYLLLKTFINSPNHVFSQAQLIEQVLKDNLESMERIVDIHVQTIREKLEEINPTCEPPILTHRGLGYSLSIK